MRSKRRVLFRLNHLVGMFAAGRPSSALKTMSTFSKAFGKQVGAGDGALSVAAPK